MIKTEYSQHELSENQLSAELMLGFNQIVLYLFSSFSSKEWWSQQDQRNLIIDYIEVLGSNMIKQGTKDIGFSYLILSHTDVVF